MDSYKIYSLGENAVTVEFGDEISTAINGRVFRLDDYFKENRFAGFIETIPAYASLTVFYDIPTVRKNFPEFKAAFEAVKFLIGEGLKNQQTKKVENNRTVEIPVCFSDEYAPDIGLICEKTKIEKAEFIEIFTSREYRVFMIGFLPGFAYMGEVDERIAAPRKQNPRLCVPKGSVGIAGGQTGIYPFDSPGGWQIVGKTDAEMFSPSSANPTLLKPGDSVKFYAVEKSHQVA